jgi:hypothetical protein
LDTLKNASDEQLARFDIAEVNLACATGLPGSESLRRESCLAWLEKAAVWTRQHTDLTIERFRNKPEAFLHSEAIFRIVALYEVLQRGMKVRYAAHRIGDSTNPWADSRDNFIHGPISGYGGTCASLPILTIAVGRRLGYPLKLVATQSHLFARWDGPDGTRFNIDGHANDSPGGGPNIRPDEYYLSWPEDIRDEGWKSTYYLRSMTYREEIASSLMQRGWCLKDGGNLSGAVGAFAQGASLCSDNILWKKRLKTEYEEWEDRIKEKVKASPHWRRLKGIRITFPRQRRYPGIAEAEEQSIIRLEIWERLLNNRAFMHALSKSPNPGHLVINCKS